MNSRLLFSLPEQSETAANSRQLEFLAIRSKAVYALFGNEKLCDEQCGILIDCIVDLFIMQKKPISDAIEFLEKEFTGVWDCAFIDRSTKEETSMATDYVFNVKLENYEFTVYDYKLS